MLGYGLTLREIAYSQVKLTSSLMYFRKLSLNAINESFPVCNQV